jgi:hypothetical protein
MFSRGMNDIWSLLSMCTNSPEAIVPLLQDSRYLDTAGSSRSGQPCSGSHTPIHPLLIVNWRPKDRRQEIYPKLSPSGSLCYA